MLLLFLLLLAPTVASASGHCGAAAAPQAFAKCLRLPTQDASIAWTHHPHNATVDLSFTGSFISPSGWVALGINPDSPSMVGARSLISFADPTSGSLLLLPFLLDLSVKLQGSPLTSRSLDIPLLSSSTSLIHSPSVALEANAWVVHCRSAEEEKATREEGGRRRGGTGGAGGEGSSVAKGAGFA